ncbi:hypothetical protein Tco_0386802 [Tanacetum coccineum]
MGSGEGYGVAVEWTWEGGIARKPWEMGWYGFGGSGYGTGLLHRLAVQGLRIGLQSLAQSLSECTQMLL